MVSKTQVLINKAAKAVKKEGFAGFMKRAKGYVVREYQEKCQTKKQRVYKDVLFISGCNEALPHPHRYRVLHQIEQLEANDFTCDTVYFTKLTSDMVRFYGAFVFFRCPMTEVIREFLKCAKSLNKPVWYDIDDLVIDTHYTDQIQWLKNMSLEEKWQYDENVRRMGELLCQCDAAITTTNCLAEELRKYVPKVFINRNCASEEMLALSEAAYRRRQRGDDKVVLGYFSGSATHLDDMNLILPALIEIMERFSNTELLIVGILDVPEQLHHYKERVKVLPFVDYRKLPELMGTVDINLGPLTDTIFNAAKSENKWVEAALMRVVTVASDVGAFSDRIEEGITGFLCKDPEAWVETLANLIQNPDVRRKVGIAAYDYCLKNCVTTYTGGPLTEWIRQNTSDRCALVLPGLQISGGVRVALTHMEMLWKSGAQVTLVLLEGSEEWYRESQKNRFPVLSLKEVQIDGQFDLAVATMWNTVDFVQKYPKIGRRHYLVQNYEVDFYPPGSIYRSPASATYNHCLGLQYVTISKWCQQWLKDQYNRAAEYIPNGINPSNYTVRKRDLSGRVRILIEGDCEAEHKNVDESFRIVAMLPKEQYEVWYLSYKGKPKDWYRVDRFFHNVPYEQTPKIYESCDILLKTSVLESFSYPPLEMMAAGGYVVALPNDGNREYLEDGWNCLFYERGSIEEAVKKIVNLCKNIELQERLLENGLATVRQRDWSHIAPQICRYYLNKK